MSKKIKIVFSISLIPVLYFVGLIKNENLFVENFYSNSLYKFISEILRFSNYWTDIAIGDFLYILTVFLIFYKFLYKLKSLSNSLIELGSLLFIITTLFYFFWGTNYKRISLKNKLTSNEEIDIVKLVIFTNQIIDKTNKKHLELFDLDSAVPFDRRSFEEVKNTSILDFKNIKILKQDSILNFDYKYPSIKKSLFSSGLTLMGFSGYINPFTGEANINTKIPKNSIPFVINHEIAHQLGIASERDANFISYISLLNSLDEFHKFLALSYCLKECLNELYKNDRESYLNSIKKINTGIISNYKQIQNFWNKYNGPIEIVSKNMYDKFLKQNNLKSGIKNYGETISLILSYHNVK
tara:strand:+ start:1426 stop:2487 length:1062 start_codon:yes stop_codon:yes gene_type:complete